MIIVFDGVCNFCNGWVRFVLNRDAEKRFRSAATQSRTGADLLDKFGYSSIDPDTMLFIHNDRRYAKSDAVIHILAALKGFWRVALITKIIPRRFRDALYDRFAKNRYRVAGKSSHCQLPPADRTSQFLP